METCLRRSSTGALLAAAFLVASLPGSAAYADCATPANAIEAENCLPGNPPSEWDVAGAGDSTIQGFATDISVNRGETVRFKVDTDATELPDRHLPPGLLRRQRGAPGGHGHALGPAPPDPAGLPDESPPGSSTAATGPSPPRGPSRPSATSGVYIARLVRTGHRRGQSHRLRRPRRRRDLGPALPDRRTRRGRRTTATAATASTGVGPGTRRSGLQGQLQPPVHDARLTHRRTGCSTPSTRWSAGSRRNGYDVELLHRRRHRPARRR